MAGGNGQRKYLIISSKSSTFNRNLHLLREKQLRLPSSRSGPLEVNLSATNREFLIRKYTSEDEEAKDSIDIFDSMYTEVKDNLLRDSFARFLLRLRTLSTSSRDIVLSLYSDSS